MHRPTVSRLVLALMITTSPLAAWANTDIGVVGMLEGSATAKKAAGGAHALKAGDPVYADEEISTGANSKLQLMLKDKSTIMVNANSNMKVREFAFNAETQDGKLAIDEVKGAFRFIGGALSKKNPVMIKTPVSSIGIRGGVNDTFIQPSGATDAVFIYGKQMDMTNADGKTISTTDFGSGLAMQTPNDLPAALSPQQVDQRLTTFATAKPVDATTSPAAGSDTKSEGDKKSDSSTKTDGDKKAESDTKSDGDSKQTAEGGDKKPTDQTASTDKKADGKPDGQASTASGLNGGDQGGTGGGTTGGTGGATALAPLGKEGGTDSGKAPLTFSPSSMQAATSPTAPQGLAPLPGLTAATGSTNQSSNDTARTAAVAKLVGDNQAILKDPLSYQAQLRQIAAQQAAGSTTTLQQQLNNAAAAPTPTTTPKTLRGIGIQKNKVGAGTPYVDSIKRFTATTDTASGGAPTLTGTATDISMQAIGAAINDPDELTSIIRPPVGQTGYFNYTPNAWDTVTVDGDVYSTGYAFTTQSGSTLLQQFNRYDSGTNTYEQLSMIAGDQLTTDAGYAAAIGATQSLAAAQGTNGISFYKFLPDLANFSGATTPYFNYGKVDVATGTVADNNPGLAVDWQKKQFLSAFLHWDNAGSATTDRNAIVAFGGVGNTIGEPLFNGLSYESKQQGTTLNNITGASAFISTDYANSAAFRNSATGEIEAVVMGGDIIGAPADQRLIEQSAMRVNNAAAAGLSGVNTTTTAGATTYNGFSAGFVVSDDGSGTLSRRAVQSGGLTVSGPQDITLVTDTATNSVAAQFKLSSIFNNPANANYSTGNPDYMVTKFGGTIDPNAHSVFLSDSLYAANHWGTSYGNFDGTSYVNSNITSINPAGSTFNDGFLVSGAAISDITAANQCTSCQYVSWGVWSTDIRTGTNGGAVMDHANMIPYVVGSLTQDLNNVISSNALSGTYNYTGPVYGQLSDSSSITRGVGGFTAGINMGTRTLDSFTGTLGVAGNNISMMGGPAAITTSGNAVFTNVPIYVGTSTPIANGTLNGALFGPAAQNIGGNLAAQNGALQATGVFLGTR